MGAWGMGVFEDDTSCEIIEDVIDEGAPAEELIIRALESSKAEYLEYLECHEIIVAGAMTHALLNGAVYEGVDDLSSWLEAQDKEQAAPHKSGLVIALGKVLSEASELNELWLENEDDYPAWKANIESIIGGLNS